MLVWKACESCSTAPLTQYKNNEIYQEITEEDDLKLTTQAIEFGLIWEEVKVILMS